MIRIVPLLATVLLAACGPRAVPEPPEPGPTPAAAAAPAPGRPSFLADHSDAIRVCHIHEGMPREVRVRYNTRTGDTLTMDSLPVSTLLPLTGEYASVAGWYINDEPITFRGRRFRRHGDERLMGVPDVVKVGEYRGVPVFVEVGVEPDTAEILYLPTRLGCEYQPYRRTGSARRAQSHAAPD